MSAIEGAAAGPKALKLALVDPNRLCSLFLHRSRDEWSGGNSGDETREASQVTMVCPLVPAPPRCIDRMLIATSCLARSQDGGETASSAANSCSSASCFNILLVHQPDCRRGRTTARPNKQRERWSP